MRTFSNILIRFGLAFFAVVMTLGAITTLFDGSPLHEPIEYGLLAASMVTLLIREFRPIAFRYVATLLAVTFTFGAVVPEYTLWTAFVGAFAGLYIVAAVAAWMAHAELVAFKTEWTDGEDDGGDEEVWLRADVAEEYRKAQETEPGLTVAEFLKRTKL
jgi:hypothetical protein